MGQMNVDQKSIVRTCDVDSIQIAERLPRRTPSLALSRNALQFQSR